MSDDSEALAQFKGTARLFPLPNVVLFPQVMQPLHIFEPRYREMTAEALASDRLIALVLLKAGWESDYAGRPPIHSVACLGRIVADQRLDDGRFNLLLRGLGRIRIVQEVATDKLFRSARAELLHDEGPPSAEQDRKLRRELDQPPAWLNDHAAALQQFQKLLKSDHPLGELTNILAFALPFDGDVKQMLLETLDVRERSRLLVGYLETKPAAMPSSAPAKKYPPQFSSN